MTRQKIIDAAIAILNEDLSAPLDKIADLAGINRRTLHRYFRDRPELVKACNDDMMKTWQEAMIGAYESAEDPVRQLELMLYAGIDCGVKYSFLTKLQEDAAYRQIPEAEKNEVYENTRDKWFSLVPLLQQKQIISNELSASWIRSLFSGMIRTTISALKTGDIAPNDVKKFAWYSFSKSIGIQ